MAPSMYQASARKNGQHQLGNKGCRGKTIRDRLISLNSNRPHSNRQAMHASSRSKASSRNATRSARSCLEPLIPFRRVSTICLPIRPRTLLLRPPIGRKSKGHAISDASSRTTFGQLIEAELSRRRSQFPFRGCDKRGDGPISVTLTTVRHMSKMRSMGKISAIKPDSVRRSRVHHHQDQTRRRYGCCPNGARSL